MSKQYIQAFPSLAINYFDSMVTAGNKAKLVYMFFGIYRSYIQQVN
jgi:hypothetical protein